MTGHLKGNESDLVREWWQALQTTDKSPGQDVARPHYNFFFTRGHRARLRRCTTVAEVAQESSAWSLVERLNRHQSDDQALLLMAGTLAHVKEDAQDGKSLAYLLGVGPAAKGEDGKLSELRFQRLMRADEPEDFLQQIRRALGIGGERADVAVLAEDLFAWSVERRYAKSQSHGMKFRWARDFYLRRPDQALIVDAQTVSKE